MRSQITEGKIQIKFFESDKCYKPRLCGGRCGNDYCSLDTSKREWVGGILRQSRLEIKHS